VGATSVIISDLHGAAGDLGAVVADDERRPVAMLDHLPRNASEQARAPRLRDLARELVDVPLGLLRDRAVKRRQVPVQTLTPTSAHLAAYERDYHPG
jgi:hypothetical protein